MIALHDVGARDWRTDNGPYILEAIAAIPPMKASLSGGGVILVDGQYEFATPLLISGMDKRVLFQGIGGAPTTSRLIYTGPDTSPAIKILTVNGWGFRDLGIYRSADASTGSRGAHVGVWATHSAAGSGGGLAAFDNVELAGWHLGVRVGDSVTNASQSEIEYRRLVLSYNDVGWQCEGGNSLAQHFRGLYGIGNGILLNNLGSDCLWVDGGSVTASLIADMVAANAGVFTLENFRSEGPSSGGRHVVRAGQTSQPTIVTVRGCRFGGNPDPSIPLITGGGGCSLMTLIGNQISGRVGPNTGHCVGSSLTMIGNAIEDTAAFVTAHANIRWRLEGNTRIGVSPPQVFVDGSGTT